MPTPRCTVAMLWATCVGCGFGAPSAAGQDGEQASNTGGPSICCRGTYALCDDSEAEANGADPNKSYWAVEKLKRGLGPQSGTIAYNDGASIVEVSSVRAARGKKSLHVKVPNDGDHHDRVVNRSNFSMPNNTS